MNCIIKAFSASLSALAALVGQPGGPPDPVAVDDPRTLEAPSLRCEARVTRQTLGGVAALSRVEGFMHQGAV
ncbi:MAG: hypothetical protein ACE5R6_19955 [Candidatus Heimdallarchaeota archaeon]